MEKKSFFANTLLMLLLVCFVSGCNSDENTSNNFSGYEDVKIQPVDKNGDLYRSWYVNTNTVHVSSDTIFNNEKAIIAHFSDAVSTYNVIKLIGNNYSYDPVNLPDEYNIEGLEIVFSGEVRNCDVCDRAHLPLFLSDLKVKKGGVIK
jgi:hypothetical protein